jgi:hypothetical protein
MAKRKRKQKRTRTAAEIMAVPDLSAHKLRSDFSFLKPRDLSEKLRPPARSVREAAVAARSVREAAAVDSDCVVARGIDTGNEA